MDIESYDKLKQYRERLRRDYEQVRNRNGSYSEEDTLRLSYLCLTTLVHRFDLIRHPAFISSMELYGSSEGGNSQNLSRAIFEISDFLTETINEIFDRIN